MIWRMVLRFSCHIICLFVFAFEVYVYDVMLLQKQDIFLSITSNTEISKLLYATHCSYANGMK